MSIEQSFAPIQWLTFAAGKASEVNFSTHSAKFINSGAKSSSCLVTDFDDSKSDYLVTANIKNKAIDVVGAGVFSIAKLMMLTVDGDSLLNQVHNNHISVLKEFTDDETLLNKWLEGFKRALVDKNKKSDNLVKQVYYPVSDSDAADIDYHMLCPLFASSLAQELHGAVSRTRFDEESVMIRKGKRGTMIITISGIHFFLQWQCRILAVRNLKMCLY